LWHFKDILFKMARAEVSGIVKDVPFVPTCTRQTFDIVIFGAVRNLPASLPTSRYLFASKYKWAAVNRRDGDVFPEHDIRADLQEVESLVRDQPFVETLRSEREHQIDRPMGTP